MSVVPNERAREFVSKELIPLEKQFITGSFQSLGPTLDGLKSKVKELGLWAPTAPKALGGMGLSFAEYVPISEAIGYSPLGHYVFGCNAPDSGNIELLAEHGTPAQKERFLAPLVTGHIRSCFAMTEKEVAGSNPLLLRTTAEKKGEKYILNGEKWFTTGADGAEFCIVVAITHPTAPPHLQASLFIVPMNTPGLKRVRNIPVMGHTGDGLHSHSELRFENCEVGAENRLGGEGEGFVLAQQRLGPGRIHHCSRWLGIMARSLDLLCDRANHRKIESDQLLSSKQFIEGWVAESAAELFASRAMVLETAKKIDAKGSKGSQVEISLLKFFSAGCLERAVDRAVQAHGALGLSDDAILAYFYRHERGARIYDGADEVHKVSAGSKILAGKWK